MTTARSFNRKYLLVCSIQQMSPFWQQAAKPSASLISRVVIRKDLMYNVSLEPRKLLRHWGQNTIPVRYGTSAVLSHPSWYTVGTSLCTLIQHTKQTVLSLSSYWFIFKLIILSACLVGRYVCRPCNFSSFIRLCLSFATIPAFTVKSSQFKSSSYYLKEENTRTCLVW